MPRKNSLDTFGKKIGDKLRAKKKKMNDKKRKPVVPRVILNYESKPQYAKSNNERDVPARSISPKEGNVAVNAKTGPEVQRKAVTKVRSKTIKVDDAAGVIGVTKKKVTKKKTVRKKRGRKKKAED